MSYDAYRRHAATAEAKRYLRTRDVEKADEARILNENERLVRSRAWIAEWNARHQENTNGKDTREEVQRPRTEVVGYPPQEREEGKKARGPTVSDGNTEHERDWTKDDPLPF